MTTLHTERETYEARLPQMLINHNGQYVVIQGRDVAHFSDTYEAALDWAYDKYGLDAFFVKKVDPDQNIAHFTRDLGPCRP